MKKLNPKHIKDPPPAFLGNKEMLEKFTEGEPISLREKAQRNKRHFKRRSSDLMFKAIDQKEKPSNDNLGSHRLSELCFFKNHQRF